MPLNVAGLNNLLRAGLVGTVTRAHLRVTQSHATNRTLRPVLRLLYQALLDRVEVGDEIVNISLSYEPGAVGVLDLTFRKAGAEEATQHLIPLEES